MNKITRTMLLVSLLCLSLGAVPAWAQADCASGSVKLTGMVITNSAGTSLAPMCQHITTGQIIFQPHSLRFEGATEDAFELSVDPPDLAADASLTIGDTTVSFRAVAVADMVDGIAFIADRGYTVTRIDQIHITPETAGTVDIMPRKCEGVEAPASGQALLSAAFDGTATAETVQNGSLTSTGADLIMVAGDRLCVDYSGDTAGELVGVTITFSLQVN